MYLKVTWSFLSSYLPRAGFIGSTAMPGLYTPGLEPRTLCIHTRFTSALTSRGLSPDSVVAAPSLDILCGDGGGAELG